MIKKLKCGVTISNLVRMNNVQDQEKYVKHKLIQKLSHYILNHLEELPITIIRQERPELNSVVYTMDFNIVSHEENLS